MVKNDAKVAEEKLWSTYGDMVNLIERHIYDGSDNRNRLMDSRDTSPDGKVYLVTDQGRPSELRTPTGTIQFGGGSVKAKASVEGIGSLGLTKVKRSETGIVPLDCSPVCNFEWMPFGPFYEVDMSKDQ